MVLKLRLTVNPKKCPQNHKCPAIAICPKGAISQETINSLPVINGDLCVVCGKCTEFCPMEAFEKVDIK